MNIINSKIGLYIRKSKLAQSTKRCISILTFKFDKKGNINRSYKKLFGQEFNWENPKTLIEKIWWMLFNTDTSLWSKLADKYESRERLQERGYKHLLNELYGVYDSVDDIDFRTLPKQFVIKTTNACQTNIIVKDKSLLDITTAKKKLKKWLKFDYGILNSSIHYSAIKPRIIIEKYLHDENQPTLIDYKIWCFNGEPECVLVVSGREESSYNLNLYDLKWNSISHHITKHKNSADIDKPQTLDDMLKISKKLSEGLKQVRIDFYEINGEIIFGEFTMATGFGYFTNEYYEYLGSKIDLSDIL